jgi:hypothetical protein
MRCHQSFSFFSSDSIFFDSPTLISWGSGSENYWNIDNFSTSTSQFNIQGFKNINIYGVDMIGYVASSTASNFGGLVHDWGFTLELDGQVPLMSGNITASPNRYAITLANPQIKTFTLTKMKPSVVFTDPIKSVSDILIKGLFANGSNLQSIGSLTLKWSVTFIFYYEYEGEDLAFL